MGKGLVGIKVGGRGCCGVNAKKGGPGPVGGCEPKSQGGCESRIEVIV